MYQGTLYGQSNPPIRWLSGQKHFGIRPHMTELEPSKVGALGLGHPVGYYPNGLLGLSYNSVESLPHIWRRETSH